MLNLIIDNTVIIEEATAEDLEQTNKSLIVFIAGGKSRIIKFKDFNGVKFLKLSVFDVSKPKMENK